MSDRDYYSPQQLRNNERLHTIGEQESQIANLQRSLAQMENKLQELTQQHKRIFETLQTQIFAGKRQEDGSVVLTFSEGKVAKDLGVTTKDVEGKTVTEIFRPDIAPFVQQKFEEAFSGCCVWFEFEQNERFYITQISPLLEGDRVAEIVGTVLDITQSKRVEQKKKLYAQKCKTSLSILPHVLFSFEKREDNQITVTLFEGALTKRFGAGIKEGSLEDVMLPNMVKIIKSHVERAFLQETVDFQVSLDNRLYYGHMKPVIIQNCDTNNPKITEIVGFLTDVTEQKQVEEMLHVMTQGITNKMGEEFFHYLSRTLIDVLEVDYALIAALHKGKPGRAVTISISDKQAYLENIEYDIAHSPTEEVIKSGKICVIEGIQQIYPLDQSLRFFKVEALMGQLLYDSNGSPIGILAVMSRKPIINPGLIDSMLHLFASRATAELERKLAEEQLIKNNAILRATHESMMDGMLIVNEWDQIVHYNRKCREMWKIPEHVEQQNNANHWLMYMLSQIKDNHQATALFDLAQVNKLQPDTVEISFYDGRVYEVYSGPIDSSQQHYYGRIWIFKDLTDRKKHEEMMSQKLFYDSLTGLPNRVLFDDRLLLAISQAKRTESMLAVVILDLDCFKVFNDTLGHAAGDRLLQLVAARLADHMREGDTLCRLVGDEFQFIFPEISSLQDVAQLSQELLDKIALPFEMEGQSLTMTCSIGISLYPNDGTTQLELVKNAKAALYRSKEKGGNIYQLYTPAMTQSAFQKLTLMQDLRYAIDRNELFLQYQPRFDLSSGELIGMEALVRWQHPKLGLISPGDFIPLAEEMGFIVTLDEYVLKAACIQNKKWQQAGLKPVRVAVNISPVEFQQRNLVATIAKVLQETNLAPEYLEVEITEGVTMHKVETAITTLHELKELGIHLSIDDFGTGYSSLSYLKKFPVDTLKIDRSFIRDITVDPDDAEIVSYIIALARSLKLNVIAEGVETEEQKSFLTEKQCYEMQGFYFSPPLHTNEFANLLENVSK
ncbi:EAL domain-containing protein [Brevibacillus laterosporus]|uniref:sensor domain-containing protein n=1 Tax=Brevibacillus laterosporus TaxID=1465 RepID=UPI003D1C3A35